MRRGLLTLGAWILTAATAWAQTPVVVEYYHLDAVGSVRAITDQTRNAVVFDYAPFGDGGVGAGPVRRPCGLPRRSAIPSHGRCSRPSRTDRVPLTASQEASSVHRSPSVSILLHIASRSRSRPGQPGTFRSVPPLAFTRRVYDSSAPCSKISTVRSCGSTTQ